jgi:hypothetical protein
MSDIGCCSDEHRTIRSIQLDLCRVGTEAYARPYMFGRAWAPAPEVISGRMMMRPDIRCAARIQIPSWWRSLARHRLPFLCSYGPKVEVIGIRPHLMLATKRLPCTLLAVAPLSLDLINLLIALKTWWPGLELNRRSQPFRCAMQATR